MTEKKARDSFEDYIREEVKKELLEKVEKMKETPANRGMFMWVQGYNQAIKALKKHLT